MDLSEYMTTEQAAQALGIKRSRVTQLIKAGILEADRFGRVWAIKRESVEARKADNPGPGNPNFGPGYGKK